MGARNGLRGRRGDVGTRRLLVRILRGEWPKGLSVIDPCGLDAGLQRRAREAYSGIDRWLRWHVGLVSHVLAQIDCLEERSSP